MGSYLCYKDHTKTAPTSVPFLYDLLGIVVKVGGVFNVSYF